ncbi:glycosyltransferase family 87 protein [Legionella sp. PC997]|uniref:glycosyltransferase family 87 protein n=1 Tax=Legionella sp. PC997 TaxID=2755562 RepID=UPI0015FC875C|nr:glycosyltransferase family 87 protein [Legionella sp. PC997]QMT61241.1 hypothetical protein HBNCFIEN_02636 [Legionella sp. PC997]
MSRYQKIGILLLLSFYCLLSFFIFMRYQKSDFSSLYYSCQAVLQGENPYINFSIMYMSSLKMLPANVNPPFVVWSFSFLAKLSYFNGLVVWFCLSLVLGVIGTRIAFYYAFSSQFFQKNHINLYLLYFAFFPTLMNFVTQQFGGILLFFLMLGYYFYWNHRDYFAGILWGIIIAIKLFPALLFFYVLKQGRKRVFVTMLLVFLVASFLPAVLKGPMLYQQYFKMMTGVFWYGDGWNASIYGFIYRLFFGGEIIPNKSYLIPINILYAVLLLILFLWYWRKLGPAEKDPINHQPFCLTLAMMLLMSPLGWSYYFPLLIFPLILTWFSALEEQNNSTKTMFIWLVSFFLINLPIDNMNSQDMSNYLVRISYASYCFYGLLLLTYLLTQRKKIYGNNELQSDGTKYYSLSILTGIFIFGLFIPVLFYLLRAFTLAFNL